MKNVFRITTVLCCAFLASSVSARAEDLVRVRTAFCRPSEPAYCATNHLPCDYEIYEAAAVPRLFEKVSQVEAITTMQGETEDEVLKLSLPTEALFSNVGNSITGAFKIPFFMVYFELNVSDMSPGKDKKGTLCMTDEGGESCGEKMEMKCDVYRSVESFRGR